MNKTVHTSRGKTQKYFIYVAALFFQTLQCDIVIPWGAEKRILF